MQISGNVECRIGIANRKTQDDSISISCCISCMRKLSESTWVLIDRAHYHRVRTNHINRLDELPDRSSFIDNPPPPPYAACTFL